MSTECCVHRREQLVQLTRIVLAVGIYLRYVVVAVLEGVDEPGLDGSADSEIERDPENTGAEAAAELRGVVGRSVVDHEWVEMRRVRPQCADDVCERRRLVVCGDHRKIGRS